MADMRTRAFQGLCLRSVEGHSLMKTYFDRLRPDVRKRLSNSPFNICPACVVEQQQRAGDEISVIEEFERQIRHEDEVEALKWRSEQ